MNQIVKLETTNNDLLSLNHIFEKNISLNNFNNICNYFNVLYTYNYFKYIPDDLSFYFKLKNLNLHLEYNFLYINDKNFITAYQLNIINDNDVFFIFKSTNKNLIATDYMYYTLNFYGNEKNINSLINYLNLYFDLNLSIMKYLF